MALFSLTAIYCYSLPVKTSGSLCKIRWNGIVIEPCHYRKRPAAIVRIYITL